MNMIEAVKSCFSNYFTLRGRARRSEYWWFYLFTILLSLVTGFIDGILGLGTDDIGVLSTIAALVTFIPTITAQVRRLHDTGRSGWWVGGAFIAALLIGLLVSVFALSSLGGVGSNTAPLGILVIILGIGVLVYGVVMLIFLCQDSHPGDNVYGPSPKYDSGASVFD
ncbi:DUF805 domain-containing protein [Hellea balneolensis]|uniref:DUF805 domain-containing protein n=1 Tax=Hellea balneolensis TaxID=287478 RepID=UPI0004209CDC|nr:DUF805 domain-containing protein [Hellea balneolensis]